MVDRASAYTNLLTKQLMRTSTTKDILYQEPIATVGDFAFDQSVVEVFDDMIDRSVPLYREVQEISAALAQRYYQANTKIYDVGCSTGKTLLSCSARMSDIPVNFVGVDSSEAMLEACRVNLRDANPKHSFELLCADIAEAQFQAVSVVFLNYTLQFVPKESRLSVLKQIQRDMVPNGILILSEKICHATSAEEVMTELHHDFKRRNGYSDLEISQKRDALENVLAPLTIDQNLQLLRDAGFRSTEIALKSYNFATLLAWI